MDPVSAINTALASIKTATDIAKLLRDADISLKNAETKLRLAEMISALADAKIEIAQVQGLIAEKDQVIKELGAKLAIKGEMQYEPPFYWRIQGDKRDGPYCQKCLDSQDKLIRLQGQGNDCRRCLQRDGYFEGPDYVPPQNDNRTERWSDIH